MRARIVPEADDERVAVEDGLYHASLYAAPAAVHQPYLMEAGVDRRADVLVDDRRHVGWRKGVEVDFRLDGNVVHYSGRV